MYTIQDFLIEQSQQYKDKEKEIKQRGKHTAIRRNCPFTRTSFRTADSAELS